MTSRRDAGAEERRARRAARIAWLQAHEGEIAVLSPREVVAKMKKAGLYAHTTYWQDVHLDKLWRDARRLASGPPAV